MIEPFATSREDLGQLAKRLTAVCVELEDLSNEFYAKAESIDPDPELKAEIEQKLDAIRRLMLKHGVQEETGLPCTDAVRFGAEKLLDAFF